MSQEIKSDDKIIPDDINYKYLNLNSNVPESNPDLDKNVIHVETKQNISSKIHTLFTILGYFTTLFLVIYSIFVALVISDLEDEKKLILIILIYSVFTGIKLIMVLINFEIKWKNIKTKSFITITDILLSTYLTIITMRIPLNIVSKSLNSDIQQLPNLMKNSTNSGMNNIMTIDFNTNLVVIGFIIYSFHVIFIFLLNIFEYGPTNDPYLDIPESKTQNKNKFHRLYDINYNQKECEDVNPIQNYKNDEVKKKPPLNSVKNDKSNQNNNPRIYSTLKNSFLFFTNKINKSEQQKKDCPEDHEYNETENNNKNKNNDSNNYDIKKNKIIIIKGRKSKRVDSSDESDSDNYEYDTEDSC